MSPAAAAPPAPAAHAIGVLAALALVVAILAGGSALLAHVAPASDAAATAFLGAALDGAGESVSVVGDVNGDGFDDMLVGADLGSGKGGTQPGRAFLILGGASLSWPPTVTLAEAADASFVGEGHLDHAGKAVSGAGDVNGDGLGDFLIGAPYASPTGTLTDSGRAYLVLGRRQADWGIGFDLAQADAVFDGEAPGDYAGIAVAPAGDVNGDGLDDVLIGAYRALGLESRAGKAYLVLGRQEADWGRGFGLSGADAGYLGEASDDYAGMSLAGAGDVNGDGLDDILIGAHGNDEVAQIAGIAYLVLGRPAADWGSAFALGNADGLFLGDQIRMHAGERVAGVGDLNQDGLDDFVIGAAGEPRSVDAVGRAYLIHGRADADWGMGMGLGKADATFLGAFVTETVGSALAAAGDVNRDGVDDFIVGGTDLEPADGAVAAGRCYVVLGRVRPPHAHVELADVAYMPDVLAYDGELSGEGACAGLGSGGDVNGDGFADLLIGAPLSDEGGRNAGKVYLVPGGGVRLAKRVAPPRAAPGAVVTFTMAYSYTGLPLLGEVRVVDAPPTGLQYVGCSGGITCNVEGRLVAWYLGNLATGDSGTVALAMRVPPSAPLGTVVTNTAVITSLSIPNPIAARAPLRVVAPTAEASSTSTSTPTRTPTMGASPTASATGTWPTRPTRETSTPTGTMDPTAEPSVTGTTSSTVPPEPPWAWHVYLPVADR